MHSITISVLFFVTYLSIGIALDDGMVMRRSGGGFCYEENECGPQSPQWGGQCKLGKHQSPISLPLYDHDGSRAALSFNDKYYSDDFWIKNNGHTIQVNLRREPTSSAQLKGYGLDSPYIFAQMHFHWNRPNLMGSEHVLNNQSFPMELHLVHYNSKYNSFIEAANSNDPMALAVLGIFLSHGNGGNNINAFDTIASNLPKKILPNGIQVNKKLDISPLLPKEGDSFYSYSGSLTTPPCSEVVEWRILKNALFIGPNLLEKLRGAEADEEGNLIGMNVRPLQKDNGRKLEYFTIANSSPLKVKFSDVENHSQRCVNNLGFKSIFIWLFFAIIFFV